MTLKKWIVGIDPFDQAEQGYIVHRQAPAFTAKWMIEDEDSTAFSDLVYTDADQESAVAVYDFEWTDTAPSEDLFRKTMDDAVSAIDAYLSSLELTY
tara:strand:- start:2971 stop:3261 length:291 start_codon:yes stop_codon:yes gene_type:complete